MPKSLLTNEVIVLNNKEYVIPKKYKESLKILICSPNGGFCTVHGYIPSTNYIIQPIVNINIVTKFSILKYYENKIKALQNINIDDLSINNEKLLSLTDNELSELFESCRAKIIHSMTKTISGDRNDNYRKGHDTYYVNVDKSILCHLKNNDGTLCLIDGMPIIDSIILNCIEISRTFIKPGTKKKVNSGVKVLMDKEITKIISKKKLIRLSLKDDNFDKVCIGKKEINNTI